MLHEPTHKFSALAVVAPHYPRKNVVGSKMSNTYD